MKPRVSRRLYLAVRRERDWLQAENAQLRLALHAKNNQPTRIIPTERPTP